MDRKHHKYLKLISVSVPFLLVVVVYFQNRSLFLDSLNLARNIAERSFVSLSSPLSYEQSAPLLYLYLSKIFTSIFGVSEYSLRLLPLLLAIAAIFYFLSAGKKFLDPIFSYLAVFWMGSHSLFIRYSTEPKQYIADLFATTILLYFVIKYDKIDRSLILPFAIVGIFCTWLSMPSVFIICGILPYYFVQHFRNKIAVSYLLMLSGVLAFSFIIQYIMILAPAIGSRHMQNYHQNYFLDGRVWLPEALSHDVGLIIGTFRMILGKSTIGIGSGILLSGIAIWHLVKERKAEILILVVPILAAFAASLLGKYSILERLMLFSMPLFILVMVKGVNIVYNQVVASKAILPKVLTFVTTLGILVGFVDKQGFNYLINPLEREDNRSSLVYISNHEMADKTIICTQHAYPAYDYYINHDVNHRSLNIGKAIKTNYKSDIPNLALEQSKSTNDVWILMGHMSESEIDVLIKKLDKVGIIKNSYRANRSAAILFSSEP